MLNGKKILVGISGGIAAYKTISLIRLLIKNGSEVKVVCTANAFEFVTRLTLESVSQNKVYAETFSNINDYSTEHISHTDWADIFIVAPATANIIGKFANGIADDALSTTLLAFNKSIYLAPSMNCKMWENFSVQRNINYLVNNSINIIEPEAGYLACGYEGKGRMAEPEEILKKIISDTHAQKPLNNVEVLITAGPTYEAIDPVRYIGNHSSGLMGYCLAEQFAEKGATVTLISGPTHLDVKNNNIKLIRVQSADEMNKACIEHFSHSHIAVMAAAVADYKPEVQHTEKIKKKSAVLNIKLVPTPDILAHLGAVKKKHQILIGFALETNNELLNAAEKLKKKNLDFIVLNSLKDKGAGFGTSSNKIKIIDNKGVTDYKLKPKMEVAEDIVKKTIQLYNNLNNKKKIK